MVELLVENGASINAKNIHDDTPLEVASENGRTSVMKFLINKGAELEED